MSFARLSNKELGAVLASLGSIDPALRKEWRRRAKTEVVAPWAARLARQAPAGRLGAAAGRSVRAGTGDVPVLYAGKGTYQGWQPFFGLEFGGRKDSRVTYVTRSRRGQRYVVRRRTTMQFDEHLGRTGYWLFPYWRRNEAILRREVEELADRFVEEHLT